MYHVIAVIALFILILLLAIPCFFSHFADKFFKTSIYKLSRAIKRIGMNYHFTAEEWLQNEMD